MFKMAWLFIRALMGYLFGLLGVTFLMTLMPIFASFALFKFTRNFFDKYIQYLTSFAFQMVVVFAFIAIVIMLNDHVSKSFSALFDLVRPYDQTIFSDGGGAIVDMKLCTICKFTMEDIMEDGEKVGERPVCDGSGETYHPDELITDNTFLEYASVQALTLMAIVFIMHKILSLVPSMARFLAGPRYAGQLGGFAQSSESSIGLTGTRLGQTFGRGFESGYATANNTPGAIAAGFKEGMASMLVGNRVRQETTSGAVGMYVTRGGGGIIDDTIHFITSLGGRR